MADMSYQFNFERTFHVTLLYVADGLRNGNCDIMDSFVGTYHTVEVDEYAVSDQYVVLSVRNVYDTATRVSTLPYFNQARRHITLATRNGAAKANSHSAFSNGQVYKFSDVFTGRVAFNAYAS